MNNYLEWPSRLYLIRHGESAGNVARDQAHAMRRSRIEITGRDIDVPLSPRGESQSRAIAHWFAGLEAPARPQCVLASPYRRARATAAIISEALTAGGKITLDERLREKEFGILNRLTREGIEELHPAQAALRRRDGKFYYRPPGGESWCDVILRLHSALHTLSIHYAGKPIVIVAHQVVVLCLRYLLEDMDEAQILAIDAQGEVANCSITEYQISADRGKMALVRYNWIAPLQAAGIPVTTEPARSAPAV